MRIVARVCITLVLISLSAVSAWGQSNAIQENILNASINLGWVAGIIEYQGKTWENLGYLSARMSDAAAHVSQITYLLAPPYTEIDLSWVLNRIYDWDNRTSSMNTSQAASYITNIYFDLRQAMSVYFDARTEMLVWDTTCDSQYAVVGYFFGRANIAAITGDTNAVSSHISSMRQAIQAGLRQNDLKLCGFGYEADWNALTIFSGDTSSASFETSRGQMVSIVWGSQTSQNLVRDPTFSTVGTPEGGSPEGPWEAWWSSGGRLSVNVGETLELGERQYVNAQLGMKTCLMINNVTPRGPDMFGTTAQMIQASPNQTYTIAVWAASNETPNDGAVSIAVDYYWSERPITIRGGTYDWTQYSATFRTDASGIIYLRILTEDKCQIFLTGLYIGPG